MSYAIAFLSAVAVLSVRIRLIETNRMAYDMPPPLRMPESPGSREYTRECVPFKTAATLIKSPASVRTISGETFARDIVLHTTEKEYIS